MIVAADDGRRSRPLGALVFVNDARLAALRRTTTSRSPTEVARRAGLAIENARLADERAQVADALQRELLPPSLPRMPGWEVATMYEPAGEVNEVGGDFYEVFPVERRLGGGARRRLRQGRRGRGADRRGPPHDPHRRHRCRATRPRACGSSTATCAAATTSRSARSRCSSCPTRSRRPTEVLVYLAGHPHPMLVRDGARRARSASRGRCSGVVEDPTWEPVEVELEPGDQLVLYTDGVIEARRRGRRALRQRAPARRARRLPRRPSSAVERVRGALAAFGAERARTTPRWSRSARTGPEPPALGRRFAARAGAASRQA